MGKKKGPGKGSTGNPRSGGHITLRQESSGFKQSKGGSKNVKSALKLEHLQKLAVWSSGEVSIPSLGAFFGRRLATVGEAMGESPDSSMFPCQRCETILQPGHNCTIRIEKSKSKVLHRQSKSNISSKNDIVFNCHFCSHRNLKRGTPKGYMKQICPKKAKRFPESKSVISQLPKGAKLEKESGIQNETDKTVVEIALPAEECGIQNKTDKTVVEIALPAEESGIQNKTDKTVVKNALSAEDSGIQNKTDKMVVENALPAVSAETPIVDSPATPMTGTRVTLLDSKKKKRKGSGPKKPAAIESNPVPTAAEESAIVSNKRRRKSWTSLKEIAERSEHSRKVTNLTVPFIL